ncbi:MAG: class I SAM-dependent methyltransferase [Gammaproteobacteria bacterium]|nr:class I SAM-dependent methyltransferase [Gammaproteobacteria bacterium]NNJ83794.1 class I SAM-dependent methyltransferase [Gammaproteobacteria bacterium]
MSRKIYYRFSAFCSIYGFFEKSSPCGCPGWRCPGTGLWPLALARQGRRVMAVDVSDVGLALLAGEIKKQDLGDIIELVTVDLVTWSAPRSNFSLVMCSFYWDRTVFEYAHELVMPGGYLIWEGFSPLHLKYKPDAKHTMREGEPHSLLPVSFTIVECRDVDDGKSTVSRRLIARRESDAP